MSEELSVIVVGSSPWTAEPAEDDLNLRPALMLAERLGGRYHVIIPRGQAAAGELDRGAVRLYRMAARTRMAFVFAASRQVDRLATGSRQVLMSSDPLAALPIELSAARRRHPHLLHIQGAIVVPGPEYGGLVKRHVLATMTRLAVRRANGVRVVSEDLRLAVEPLARGPVAVVGSRVDTERFAPVEARPSVGGDDRTAGAPVDAIMVGSLLEVKNHAVVVRAWPQVLDRLPSARLAIVGEGPARPRLESLITELGLWSHVRLDGKVAHQAMPDLLASARCLVHPSWSEGQPRAVLEGMSSGLPVVCSDIPAHRELVPSAAGRLVPCEDPAAWATAITAVLRDPVAAAAMGCRGRARVTERHEFGASIDRYVELIRAVADGDRTGASVP